MTEQSEALVELREAATRAQCFAAEAGLSEEGFAGRWSTALKEAGRELFKAADAIEALHAREAAAKEQAERIVRAWEALPGGHYSPRIVERWLVEDMKPAIDELRVVVASYREKSRG